MNLARYSREELLALARRLRIGFRAPMASVTIAPPSPVASVSGGESDAATAEPVRGRARQR